jgi:hypothetical protein
MNRLLIILAIVILCGCGDTSQSPMAYSNDELLYHSGEMVLVQEPSESQSHWCKLDEDVTKLQIVALAHDIETKRKFYLTITSIIQNP